MAGNAIHRLRLRQQTELRLMRLTALRAMDVAISSSLDMRVTLNVLLDQALTSLEAAAADVLLLNPVTQMLEYAVARGFTGHGIQQYRVRLGQGFAGRAALERRTLIVTGAEMMERQPRGPALSGEAFVSHYVTPLVAKGEVKGVLEVYERTAAAPDPEWLQFFEALASQAAIAIDSAQLFDSLQRANLELALAYDATIEGWSRALDLRDKETEGHTRRVTELTLRLAQALGVPAAEQIHLRRGALLHDIGKMAIPDSVLLKPGALNEEEWEMMRRHPQLAFDMLAPIVYLRAALDIPYCHHERWDGSGYPRGLRAEEIPRAARIFAVADVWDALTSDRPYRAAWPPEKVREYLAAESSRLFDPAVVQGFLALVVEDSEFNTIHRTA
jgi:putative nucleotidyltransferase with HDIG domain